MYGIKLIWLNTVEYLSKIKNIIFNYYFKFIDRLELNTKNISDSNYKNLGPVNDIQNGDEYFKALDWALKDEKILNIALAGPYGSGKSSVISTYLKKHPSMKVINLSLASFLEEKKDKDGNIQQILVNIGGEEKIEEGILKQLFYKVDYKKIPQSRYRKLHNVSRVGIFSNLALLTLIACVIITFFSPDKFENVMEIISNTGNWLGIDKDFAIIIAFALIVLVVYLFSYFFWCISSNYKVKELKFSDKASISTQEENKESIFNKNMDEIVYFFEATDFDTVFIEDLDRFESAEIFIKLRELNTILNNYEMIRRRIVFVYAIKDDMFIDKDRTKFFDFIIPVIPYINSTNSGEILLNWIKSDKNDDRDGKDAYKYAITPEYITKISPYLDDMRVLTNICNEFVIYKNTLKTNQGLTLLDQSMMSLIIFKNLYPSDFADLQLEKGVIKKAFINKKEFIIRQSKLLDDEKSEIIRKLESIESDILLNIKELKAAMLFYLSGGHGLVLSITVKGVNYNFDSIMSDDFEIDKLKDTMIITIYLNQNRSQVSNTIQNIDEITKISGNNIGYIERYKYLQESIPERQAELKSQVEAIENKMHGIKALSLQELLELYAAEIVLSEDVRKNKLLVFLLRNGYIDETYANYINYFHSNSITRDDMNFILSVRNREAMEYSYSIIKCGKVIDRLLDHEFEQKEIYNFDLLDYLLSNSSDGVKCQLLIQQLSDGGKDSWQFINEFVEKTTNLDLFIQLLGTSWASMWHYIHLNSTLTEGKKLFYFKLILANVEIDQIVKMNFKSDVKQFMIDKPDILRQLSTLDLSILKSIISEINIKFRQLECEGVSEDLLEYIFNNNHYEINMAMLESVVTMKKPVEVQSLYISNYTVIRGMEYQPLKDYISENFIEYVENVVLGVKGNNDESIDTVLSILNRITENIEICVALIHKEKAVLQNFTECCIERIEESATLKNAVKSIWDTFLDTNKVVANWKNMITYWEQFTITESLLNFIEKDIDILVICQNTEVIKDEFVKDMIISNIDLSVYCKFINRFKVTDFTNDFSEFSLEQLSKLLDCSYFDLSPERYWSMKESHPELLIKFILKNKDTFINNLDKFALEISDVEKLIYTEYMTEEEKLSIIKTLDISLITEEIAHVIRTMKIQVDKNIVEKTWTLLAEEDRYELFLNQINSYSHDEIADKLAMLGGDYTALSNRDSSHNARLHNTEYNRKLIDHLYEINYLTSRKYEKEKYIIGRVKAKK